MATTATYSVINPTPGVQYSAPSAYQVIPDNHSTVTCTCQTFDAAGNLVVTTITSYNYDVSTGANKNSFTYTGNTSNAATSQTNGSDIFAPSGKVSGNVYRLAMYLTYTGRVVNNPPNAPTGLTPSGGGVVTTLTPTLAGSFSDPDAGNTLYQYEILVNNASNGGGSQIWDSGVVNASSAEITNGAFSKVYAGSALAFGSSYSWRARTADNLGSWGPYSAWQNFSTAQGPNAPGGVSPSGLQSSLTPAFSFQYTHPSSVNEQSYHYQIKAANGGALVYDSGTIANNVATGSTVSGTIPGGANLQYGQSYTFTVWTTDTNGAVGPTTSTGFSIAAIPSVTPSSPTNNSTVSTTTPTFTWLYSDPNYSQQSYQVRIYNASTGVLIKDTGVVASAATSYTLSGTTIAFGTLCRWQIQIVNTAGIATGFSSFAFFQVQNAPSAAITSPVNLSTITNNTPNVVWTYTPGSGAFAQASAQVLLMDTNNNVIGTYSLTGTGTTLALPVGILQNNTTYHLQVKVTDTASSVGSSVIITFTLLYTPPADMQGQALPAAQNYIINPYMNQDGGAGRPAGTGWGGWTSGTGTLVIAIDPNISTPVQHANGDGLVRGAHLQGITSNPADTFTGIATTHIVDLPTAAFVPGVTRVSAAAWLMVQSTGATPVGPLSVHAHMVIEFLDNAFATISQAVGAFQYDTGGAWVWYQGPQNALIPANCRRLRIQFDIESDHANQLGYAWWADGQVEASDQLVTGYLMNTDGGGGVATGWNGTFTGTGITDVFSVDAAQTPPSQVPGQGNGAQKVSITASTQAGSAHVRQNPTIASLGLNVGDVVNLYAYVKVAKTGGGSPGGRLQLEFKDGSNSVIQTSTSALQLDTAGAWALLSLTGITIPANAVTIFPETQARAQAAGDTVDCWFTDVWLEKNGAVVSDAMFVAGDLGTGYFFDSTGYSHRIPLAGNLPTITANPGADTDPTNANGATITIGWDSSLADATRFTGYLIERRRQDQSTDDTAWMTLTIITNKAIGSFTDWSAGSNVSYQYSIRQTIIYVTGETGISANRTLVYGSVNFSPAWYLTNVDSTIYNLRLKTAAIDRVFGWRERAIYSDFLGRVGTARDAGPPAGQLITQSFYFNDVFGDDHDAIRRLFISMQQLNVVWYLKNPTGVVLPCYLENFDIQQKDTGSDRMDVVTLTCRQAQATSDY